MDWLRIECKDGLWYLRCRSFVFCTRHTVVSLAFRTQSGPYAASYVGRYQYVNHYVDNKYNVKFVTSLFPFLRYSWIYGAVTWIG
jgi:hypothetical protein